MNFLIDRNLAVGLMIVDECYNDAPPQVDKLERLSEKKLDLDLE